MEEEVDGGKPLGSDRGFVMSDGDVSVDDAHVVVVVVFVIVIVIVDVDIDVDGDGDGCYGYVDCLATEAKC